MDSKQFIKEALQTESDDFEEIRIRLDKDRTIRLLHAATGMVDEAAEFLGAVRKYIFYNKPIDELNLKEELGDSDWFKAIACDELGLTFEEIWDAVISKLRSRYAEKFSEGEAINRDLESERDALAKLPEFNTATKVVRDVMLSRYCWVCRGNHLLIASECPAMSGVA